MFGENLDNLLNNISNQFGISVGGVILFFSGIAAIILFIIISWLVQKGLYRRRRRKYSNHIFAVRAEKKKLDATQQQLIRDMAEFLPDSTLAYVLFRNEAKYNHCARKMLSGNPGLEKELAALRIVLGFGRESHESLPASTAVLDPGCNLTCLKSGRYSAGIVRSQETEGFRVDIRSGVWFQAGERITIMFTNPRGRFQVETRILAAEGHSILLEHSEQISLTQNRNYFRKEYSGIIRLRRIDGPVDMMHFSCLDIGGGGLSFVSGKESFLRGDLLRCRIDNIGDFTLRAVRVTRGGRIVHGEFEEITEQVRDRIFQTMFHKKS